MNKIPENRLRGIVLALQSVSPPLANQVRQLQNTFLELPAESTQADDKTFKTFTTSFPIPRDLAQAVLRILEIFNQSETGQNYRGIGGQTSADLIEAWRGFIS